jgi:predicted dehydrogenase
MYDLMRYLAGAPVRSIEATAISAAPPTLRTDNFSATLGYEDGSVGSLVYTALGPKGGPGKERLEVFCDGEAWLLDDFKRLVRQSSGETLWESSETDKGHFTELKETGERLKAGETAPIPIEELIETSATALAINDRILGFEPAS